MKDDKPLETDTEEVLEEESEEADEVGSEDVASQEQEGLDLAKLKEITGRDFKDEDDFQKHYKNLSSFVGKKKEEPKQQASNLAEKAELQELKDYVMERDFLTDNPDAKDTLKLVKAYAKDQDITLSEAWESGGFKDLVEAKKARENELEIGVKSKNRLNSIEKKKISNLATKVEKGSASEDERRELIRNFPGAL